MSAAAEAVWRGPFVVNWGREGPSCWASGRPANNTSIISQRLWQWNGPWGGRLGWETKTGSPAASQGSEGTEGFHFLGDLGAPHSVPSQTPLQVSTSPHGHPRSVDPLPLHPVAISMSLPGGPGLSLRPSLRCPWAHGPSTRLCRRCCFSLRGSYPESRRRCRGQQPRGPQASLGRLRARLPAASRSRVGV